MRSLKLASKPINGTGFFDAIATVKKYFCRVFFTNDFKVIISKCRFL